MEAFSEAVAADVRRRISVLSGEIRLLTSAATMH